MALGGDDPVAVALAGAIQEGDLALLRRLLAQHPEMATARFGETPLHWADSSDDVEVLDALLDAGTDPEAPGAVIAGGPPLEDARTTLLDEAASRGPPRIPARSTARSGTRATVASSGPRRTCWSAAAM